MSQGTTAQDVKGYVLKKGWQFREQGDELIIQSCPFCGDNSGHFNINRLMGVYQCLKCDSSDPRSRGNLWTLKKHLGDIEEPSHVAEAFGEEGLSYDVVLRSEVDQHRDLLWNDPRALKWLRDRGLTDGVINDCNLGIAYADDGHWITFPYFRSGECVNIKYRSLPPLSKQFRFKPKHETPLYGSALVSDDVILLEGETDYLSAQVMGIRNVLSLPIGAENLSPEHWDSLVAFKKIYLVLDPDRAGRVGVQKIASRLGADRCYNVRIPEGMDVNDLLVKYGSEGGRTRLEACIADAKPVGKGEVATIFTALQELDEHITGTGSVEAGFASPWPSVNRVCGLLGPGEVMLLIAIPKTGKTTFAQQWLAWLAREHHVPSLMYCLEMPLWRLAQALVAGSSLVKRSEIKSLDVKMTMMDYREAPFYYGAIPKEWSFDHIREVIIYSVKRFGVEVVCFDNLQLLCRSVQNVYQEQASVSREFKKLAAEMNIAILLVVQPRKMDERGMPGMYSAKGAADIIADADGMLSMWRRPAHGSQEAVASDQLRNAEVPSFAPETLIRVPATRYRPGGQAVLFFDGDVATFTEVETNSG